MNQVWKEALNLSLEEDWDMNAMNFFVDSRENTKTGMLALNENYPLNPKGRIEESELLNTKAPTTPLIKKRRKSRKCSSKIKEQASKEDLRIRNVNASKTHRQRIKHKACKLRNENSELIEAMKTLNLSCDFRNRQNQICHIQRLIVRLSKIIAPIIVQLLKKVSLYQLSISTPDSLTQTFHSYFKLNNQIDSEVLLFLNSLINLINL